MAPPTRAGRKRKVAEEEEENRSSSSSTSGSEEEAEEEQERKELPQRSTRGRRTKQLMEDEADQAFWSQDAWQEREEEDDEIQSDEFTSDDFADSSDSDMELDEQAEQQQEAEEAAQRARDSGTTTTGKRSKRDVDEDDDPQAKKKKPRYVDPALAKVTRKKRHAGAGASEGAVADGTILAEKGPRVARRAAPHVILPRSIEVRASTKSVTKTSQQIAEQEAKKAKVKAASAQPVEATKKLTHREMLEAAAITEFENKRSLEAMLLLQEHQKKQRESEENSEEAQGPRILFKSNASGNFISYSDASLFPIQRVIGKQPTPSLCAVSKTPAKYRMPGSLVPFASVEAYKVLKGR